MGRPPARLITIGGPAVVVACAVGMLLSRGAAGDPRLPLALDAGAALVASVLCARASSRAGNRRGRVAWTCQAIACGLWVLAPLTWLFSPDGGWRSTAGAGRLGLLLFVAAGLWLSSRASDWRARVRLLLDGTVGAAAMLIVVWAFVIGPILPATHPNAVVLLVNPLGALVLLIFYGFLALTEFRPGRRRMPALFVMGLSGICLADLRFAETSLADGGPPGSLDTAGWLLGFVTLGAAASVYRGTTSRQTLPPSTGWLVFIPYLALLPAATTMGWQAVTRGTVPTTEVVAGVIIVLVVLIRQLVILIENRSLVAKLMASEELLRHQASHDALTGLGNRTLLVGRLEEALREQPEPLSLIFCDLDDFKTVNDTMGHQAGDDLLAQVGQRLRAVMRPEDTVVRMGGDEFAAVMGCSLADAQVIADRLWRSFQEPYPIRGRWVSVRASIGVASVPARRSMDADELLRAADDAMYRAKRSGKNGVRLFEPVTADLRG